MIIDGKKISSEVKEKLKKEILNLNSQGIKPKLCIIQIGNIPASDVYVRNKIKSAIDTGIEVEHINLPSDISQDKLINQINIKNKDKNIDGILVQLPLPRHINEDLIINAIDENKDVDGFHYVNIAKLWSTKKGIENIILPCTPKGIIKLIKSVESNIASKKAVVIGRSNIVGKPIAALLLSENCTVTICHSHTKNLAEICQNADIIVVAIGQAKFIKKEHVHKGQIIIDVGMNRDENGKLCGDVDFNEVSQIVDYITPVPGGVGPMTIAMLLQNLIELTKTKYKIK